MAAIATSLISAFGPMLLNKLFPGKTAEKKAMPTQGPQQQDLMAQIFGHLSGNNGMMNQGMSNIKDMLGGDNGAFEKSAMRQFNQQIVPGLSEMFTGGMGVPGAESAQDSSAFGQQLGQAGAGLSERLAMGRQGQKEKGMTQLMDLFKQFMQPQFKYTDIAGTKGAGEAMAPEMGKLLGKSLPDAMSQIGDYGKKWWGS